MRWKDLSKTEKLCFVYFVVTKLKDKLESLCLLQWSQRNE
jgi:hypothetical protein